MKTRWRGLTLIELVICMGMLIVLSVMLAAIWGNSYAIFRRGTTRMTVTQRAREVIRRVTPLVMCAKAPDEISAAVLVPPTSDDGSITTATSLEFITADNILAPMAPVNARSPVHYRYRISHDPDRSVRVRELNFVSGGPVGGPNSERILAYNIDELHFDRLSLNLVRVRALTSDLIRNSANQEEELKVERSAVLAIPYYSSTR